MILVEILRMFVPGKAVMRLERHPVIAGPTRRVVEALVENQEALQPLGQKFFREVEQGSNPVVAVTTRPDVGRSG